MDYMTDGIWRECVRARKLAYIICKKISDDFVFGQKKKASEIFNRPKF